MFNSYFNDYTRFTTISKGKLPPKFTIPVTKFYGTENPSHRVRNFVNAMTLKGIDKYIVLLRFP